MRPMCSLVAVHIWLSSTLAEAMDWYSTEAHAPFGQIRTESGHEEYNILSSKGAKETTPPVERNRQPPRPLITLRKYLPVRRIELRPRVIVAYHTHTRREGGVNAWLEDREDAK
ncbi:hypothetical protein E4T38_02451 [Aureobasidium subglaciale]|nr:hypothetical protein E4T38_02451 [Aureobasidium subglaciale]KAI5228140.1 hypothetical protein E4T40_02230 [Aureobasidium subglaciale]KAI5231510.1 hypothetical protein E4T41_02450 [Aureobasidium subglaciale]KAI5265459.1 hypothetical protein E4T46_02228 [Aureobasidium subglaciale]